MPQDHAYYRRRGPATLRLLYVPFLVSYWGVGVAKWIHSRFATPYLNALQREVEKDL
jgi:hypothetical protein